MINGATMPSGVGGVSCWCLMHTDLISIEAVTAEQSFESFPSRNSSSRFLPRFEYQYPLLPLNHLELQQLPQLSLLIIDKISKMPNYLICILLLVLSVTTTSAQTLTDVSKCSSNDALTNINNTGCQISNLECICNDLGWLAKLLPQVQKDCSPADLASTLLPLSVLGRSFCFWLLRGVLT